MPKWGKKGSVVFRAEYLFTSHTSSYNHVISGCIYLTIPSFEQKKKSNSCIKMKNNHFYWLFFLTPTCSDSWIFYVYHRLYLQRVKQSQYYSWRVRDKLSDHLEGFDSIAWPRNVLRYIFSKGWITYIFYKYIFYFWVSLWLAFI